MGSTSQICSIIEDSSVKVTRSIPFHYENDYLNLHIGDFILHPTNSLEWQGFRGFRKLKINIENGIVLGGQVNFMIGKLVEVIVDRPLGSYHPKHKDMYYPINYGYINGIIAPDGEEQDAYILGIDEPVEKFTGIVIAIVLRRDDVEEKWVVAPQGMSFTKEQISEKIMFTEQYYDSEIRM